MQHHDCAASAVPAACCCTADASTGVRQVPPGACLSGMTVPCCCCCQRGAASLLPGLGATLLLLLRLPLLYVRVAPGIVLELPALLLPLLLLTTAGACSGVSLQQPSGLHGP
jgi:hypothetical protein